MIDNKLSEQDVEVLLDSEDISKDIKVMLRNGCRVINNFEIYKRKIIISELLKNNYEIREQDDWELFSDRVKSLLKILDDFNKNNPDTSDICINDFVLEINNDFTKWLLQKKVSN